MKFRKIISLFMASVLIISMIFNLDFGISIPANAQDASKYISVKGTDLADAACKYLGYGYLQGNDRITGNAYTDCTGLIYRVLKDVGFKNMPVDTSGWISQLKNNSLGLTFGEDNIDVQTIYASSVSEYNSFVNNNAYNNYMIVLKTAVSSSEFESLELTEGTILITEKTAQSAAHAMMVLGDVDQRDVAPLSVANFETEYYKYTDKASRILSQKYSSLNAVINSALFIMDGDPTTDLTKGLTNMNTSNTYSYDTFIKTYGESYYYAVKRDNFLIMPGGTVDLGADKYSVGSKTWVIDAASSTYGVRIRNNVSGKGNGTVPLYSFRVPNNDCRYAKFSLQKVYSGTQNRRADAKYIVTTEATYAKAVASGSMNETTAKNISGIEVINTAEAAVGTKVYETVNDRITLYVAELSAPSDCVRDEGYYEVLLSTVLPSDGIGSRILSVKHFSSAKDGAGTVLGANDNMYGYFSSGSDTAPGTLTVADAKKYKDVYASFAVKKTDEEGAAISQIGFDIYDDKGEWIKKIVTDGAGIANSPVFTFSIPCDEALTKVYYVREDAGTLQTAPGLIADENFYKIEAKFGEKSDASDSLIRVFCGNSIGNCNTAVNVTDNSFTVVNEHKSVGALLCLEKIDQESGELVSAPISFNLYSDAQCTALVGVLTTVNGKGEFVFESWKLGTDGSGAGRIIYLKEDEKSANLAGLDTDTNIYKLQITGDADRNKCGVQILEVYGDYLPQMNSDGAHTVSAYDKPVNVSVHKDMEEMAYVVTGSVLAGLSAKVNGEAVTPMTITGDAVQTQILLSSDNNYSYIWRDLRKYDNEGRAITYYVEELGINCVDGISEEAFNEAQISEEGVEDYTLGFDIYNSLVRLYGEFTVIKTDENGAALEAEFGVYADSDCEKLLATIITVDGSTSCSVSELFEDEWTLVRDIDGDGDYKTVTVYVKELKSPEGFVKSESAEKIVITGQKTASEAKVAGPVLTVVNKPTSILISKTDAVNGREIKGATLELLSADENGSITDDYYTTWISGCDGVDASGEIIPHTIRAIPSGYYILRESNTPNGYLRANEMLIYVDETPLLQKFTMKDERVYGYLNLYKHDPDGHGIEGVKFLITRTDTNETWEIETLEDGSAVSPHLPIDEISDEGLVSVVYTIQEIYVPAGYVLDESVREFSFAYEDENTGLVRYDLSVNNDFQKGRIAVLKRGFSVIGSEVFESAYGLDVHRLIKEYTYLKGVEFSVYSDRELTDKVCTITTQGDGISYSDYLRTGTYYAVETYTPKGYAKDLNEDGTNVVYEFVIEGSSQDEQTGALSYVIDVTGDIENRLLSSTLSIVKKGEDANGERIPLENVYFGVFTAEDTCIAIIKTGADGIATLTDTLPAGNYYYRELKSSDDKFILDSTQYPFSVDYDNDDVHIELFEEVINHVKTGRVEIYKQNPEGSELPQAEFALVCDKDGSEITLVTNSDGYASVDGLKVGEFGANNEFIWYAYHLYEKKAPEGYELDDTVTSFTFENGSVTIDALTKTFSFVNVKTPEETTPEETTPEETTPEETIPEETTRVYVPVSDTPFGISSGFLPGALLLGFGFLLLSMGYLFLCRKRLIKR